MINVSFNGVKNYYLARSISVLLLHPCEKVGHLKVVDLRPFLERMVVTTGTGETQAHECHHRVFGEPNGILMNLVEVEGAILAAAAGGYKKLAHHLIPGLVLLNRTANPVVEGANCSRVQLLIAGSRFAVREQQ